MIPECYRVPYAARRSVSRRALVFVSEFLDIRETIRVGLGLKLVDFEQSERFGAAPKLGLGGGRLCGRGTTCIVFAPHVRCVTCDL